MGWTQYMADANLAPVSLSLFQFIEFLLTRFLPLKIWVSLLTQKTITCIVCFSTFLLYMKLHSCNEFTMLPEVILQRIHPSDLVHSMATDYSSHLGWDSCPDQHLAHSNGRSRERKSENVDSSEQFIAYPVKTNLHQQITHIEFPLLGQLPGSLSKKQ